MNQTKMNWDDQSPTNANEDVAVQAQGATDQTAGEVVENEATGTSLIVLEKRDVTALFKDRGCDPILEEIKKKVESLVLDPTTKKGREEITSVAWKLRRTKTTLDEAGKTLKEEAQKVVDSVDAERKRMRDWLDGYISEVYKPVEEYKAREQKRLDEHKACVEQLTSLKSFAYQNEKSMPSTSDDIAGALEQNKALYESRDWQEFSDQARSVFEANEAILTLAKNEKKAAEEKAVEDERIRLENEEKARLAREEEIRNEEKAKAEKIRIAAHEAALEKLAAQMPDNDGLTSSYYAAKADLLQGHYDRNWEEFSAKAEEIYKSVQMRLKTVHEAAVKREADETERKAAEDKKRQEEETAAAVKKAQDEKDAQAAAEQKRLDDAKEAAEAAERKREADAAHRARIKSDIMEAIKACMNQTALDVNDIDNIAEALMYGQIPHTKVTF